MFTMSESHDVQEIRRLELEKTQKEMRDAVRAREIEAQVKREEAPAEREEAQAKERNAVQQLKVRQISDEDIADVLSISMGIVCDEKMDSGIKPE
jgi:hypothetical protein